MEFLKKLFKDDETQVIGLCGFKKEAEVQFFVPKLNVSVPTFEANYQKNFFLL